MQDYWDSDVVSTAVARNSSLGEGVEHPAPFPEDIVRLPILMATEDGDLALDPFKRSGTTGRVSNVHKRFFVRYDIKQYSGDYKTIHRQSAIAYLQPALFYFISIGNRLLFLQFSNKVLSEHPGSKQINLRQERHTHGSCQLHPNERWNMQGI